MKIPKAVQEFLDKLECEGGLSDMVDYGIDVKAIKEADPVLGKALSNFVDAKLEVDLALKKYE